MTQPNDLRLQAVMPAPPEAVYAALTDAAALRVWLAEHAEVALPDRYEFWGRYTPDGAEPHQRLLHADERTLRFAWTVDGVESTVSFDLAEDESGTLLTLRQSDLPSFHEVLADTAGARGSLQTFWSLSIANLSDHLSGRELTPKCDFTSAELHDSVVIDAAPQAVFDSLTQPEQFRRWFGANIDIEPYVGGRFAMGGFELDPGGAKFVEFEPGRKATLLFADGITQGWELADSDGKTRLTFVQSGFDPHNPPYPGWIGWLGGVAAVAALPRTPAVAHDLASDRAPWCASGDAEHRRLAVFQRGIDGKPQAKSPGFPRCRRSAPNSMIGCALIRIPRIYQPGWRLLRAAPAGEPGLPRRQPCHVAAGAQRSPCSRQPGAAGKAYPATPNAPRTRLRSDPRYLGRWSMGPRAAR